MAISDGFKLSVGVSRRRQIHQGSPTSATEFENLRSDANRTQELKSNLINQGEKILEKKLPISHEEENYYANKRVFTNLSKISGDAGYNEKSMVDKLPAQKSGAEMFRYQQNMPSYFRLMDDPKYRNVQHKQADGQPLSMMQIISKNQGWITVGTQSQDRKHPVEKQKLGDVKKVNVLSPEWMQVTHKMPGPDPLEAVSVKHGVRKETNRTFLVERSQPKKSVFEIGSHRHNLPTKEIT